MKAKLLKSLTAVMLFLIPYLQYGQTPNLGAATPFALFTAAGAFNNLGASVIVGDIGTDVGAFSGFPPGTVVGQIHVADAVSAQAAIDVDIAYSFLAGITCDSVIGTTLGNGQVLPPNVYCLGAASTVNGQLILDGLGDPNAYFLFQIDGALSTSVLSSVTVINSASLCNVYWQVNGAVALGEGSVFRGTILANGALSLLEASSLQGRGLSRAGAISTHNNAVNVFLEPTPSIISANGATTFCEGGSVILSGNTEGIWSNGATTASITVYTAGDYFVTNTNACGSVISNHIIVTVNPLPIADAGNDAIICNSNSQSGSVMIGAAAISGHTYLWTPATGLSSTVISNPIASPFVTTTYTLTETITATGCQNSNSVTVTVIPFPNCTIGGNGLICPGQSTQLCVASGASSYLWSTGESTSCITVNTAGTYSITVTNSAGCTNVCSKIVAYTPLCNITGKSIICAGTTTTLKAAAGSGYTYLWSTGATSSFINVNTAGTYSVTVTQGACSNTCSVLVTVLPLPSCNITGNTLICQGQSTQLCAPAGYASYLWNTGAKTTCITVTASGSYSVLVTDVNGCKSSCCRTVIAKPNPNCLITGNLKLGIGKKTTLCATTGLILYKWNTGATNCCITVTSPGTYIVTVTGANFCTSTCSATVTNFSPDLSSRADVEDEKMLNDQGSIEVMVYPNPFSSKATIEFQNTKSDSHVLIEVYSMTGIKIATLFDQDIQQGILNHTIFDAEQLEENIYIYRIVNGDQIINGKLILLR